MLSGTTAARYDIHAGRSASSFAFSGRKQENGETMLLSSGPLGLLHSGVINLVMGSSDRGPFFHIKVVTLSSIEIPLWKPRFVKTLPQFWRCHLFVPRSLPKKFFFRQFGNFPSHKRYQKSHFLFPFFFFIWKIHFYWFTSSVPVFVFFLFSRFGNRITLVSARKS